MLVTTVPFAEIDKKPLDLLAEVGAEVVLNPMGRRLQERELLELVSDFDILVAGTEPITEYVL